MYHLTGTVTAPDGTEYRPEYYGEWPDALAVLAAIKTGAEERAEGYRLRIHNTRNGRRVVLEIRPVPEEATA